MGRSIEGINDEERPSTLPLPPTRPPPALALLPGTPFIKPLLLLPFWFTPSLPSREGVLPRPPTLATPACSTTGGPVGASGGKNGFTLQSGNSTKRAPPNTPPPPVLVGLPLLGSCGGMPW